MPAPGGLASHPEVSRSAHAVISSARFMAFKRSTVRVRAPAGQQRITLMVAVVVDEQPPGVVMVTLSVIVLAPAVKVMLGVPWPDVIVPFFRLQTYVAPGPASGTVAVLPVELRQAMAFAVISADGLSTIGMVTLEELLHPWPAVTVTPSVTEPDGPAVNLIAGVPADDVMVPPVIVQA